VSRTWLSRHRTGNRGLPVFCIRVSENRAEVHITTRKTLVLLAFLVILAVAVGLLWYYVWREPPPRRVFV